MLPLHPILSLCVCVYTHTHMDIYNPLGKRIPFVGPKFSLYIKLKFKPQSYAALCLQGVPFLLLFGDMSDMLYAKQYFFGIIVHIYISEFKLEIREQLPCFHNFSIEGKIFNKMKTIDFFTLECTTWVK